MEEIKNEEVKVEDQAINEVEKTTETDAIQTDIEKMEVALAQLQAAGADLFAEEIKNLQIKIENAKKEAAAQAEALATEVEVKVEEIHEGIVRKYGNGIAHAIEIGLLIMVVYFLAQ